MMMLTVMITVQNACDYVFDGVVNGADSCDDDEDDDTGGGDGGLVVVVVVVVTRPHANPSFCSLASSPMSSSSPS